ncbi:unnamed protein product [Vicia faba]|uniref:Reverse transcriptase n=1 Tax=Vicia faba TaxID=3906 RepID=A0AAV0Z7T4_VICFA|nr:unnamed protein product [Vicia faba]
MALKLDMSKAYDHLEWEFVTTTLRSILLGRNVEDHVKDAIREELQVLKVENHLKYLGLPVTFGKSKKEIFSLVKERAWKKIKGLKEKFLSRAGKEVLIKTVAHAILNFIMSCYKLPVSYCYEIEAMIVNFWWGSKDGKRKIY